MSLTYFDSIFLLIILRIWKEYCGCIFFLTVNVSASFSTITSYFYTTVVVDAIDVGDLGDLH